VDDMVDLNHFLFSLNCHSDSQMLWREIMLLRAILQDTEAQLLAASPKPPPVSTLENVG